MAMQPITFYVDMFSEQSDAEDSRLKLLTMLKCLVTTNLIYLQSHPDTPRLYQAGVVYQPEFGTEEWQDIPTTLRRKFGDCEDLAAYRVAELRYFDGVMADPYIKWRVVKGAYRFHALVKHPNGKIEDPSRRLGMDKWQAYLSR